METTWIIVVLAAIIVMLFASHSARGARIKELEAKLAHVQERVEALRHEFYLENWQSPEQTQFQLTAPPFANGAHLPEMRVLPATRKPHHSLLEQSAEVLFLLLIGGAVILIVSGAH